MVTRRNIVHSSGIILLRLDQVAEKYTISNEGKALSSYYYMLKIRRSCNIQNS